MESKAKKPRVDFVEVHLAEEIFRALAEMQPGWFATPIQRLNVIREKMSDRLIQASNLGKERDYLGFHLRDITEAILSVRKDGRFEKSLHDEAEEILSGLCMFGGFNDAPDDRKRKQAFSFGRPCEYCWRTEAVCRRSDRLVSVCHIHDALPPVTASDRQSASEEVQHELRKQDQEVNVVRREIDRSIRLKKSSPESFYNSTSSGARNPIWVVGNIAPPDLQEVSWRFWVEEHFPLVFEYLVGGGRSASLATPKETIAALEDRALGLEERDALDDPWNWLPPLRRCEAWHQAFQFRRAK